MQFLFMLALMVISYIIAPKPKTEEPAVQEGQVPTASANAPIPVVFGEVELKQSNVVFWGDPDTKPIYTKSGKK